MVDGHDMAWQVVVDRALVTKLATVAAEMANKIVKKIKAALAQEVCRHKYDFHTQQIRFAGGAEKGRRLPAEGVDPAD